MPIDHNRLSLLKRGVRLEYFTVGWNVLEAIVAIGAGVLASSIALVGFGLDSIIETLSGLVLLWRLRKEVRGGDAEESERAEKIALIVVGITFFLLAFYVAYESGKKLLFQEAPEESIVGIVLAVISLIVMPLLFYFKLKTGRQLSSKALEADAMETAICTYLSFTLLLGLSLNALFGWWWADPVAAIAMLPVIIKEGWEAFSEAKE
jgi:cation diffusion facilitator family transporter